MTIDGEERVQSFADLSRVLQAYNASNEKYVSTQAAAAMIISLRDCGTNTFQASEKTSPAHIDKIFNESARNLVNEMLEYRAG